MSSRTSSSLRKWDRRLLAIGTRIVPAAERQEWLRSWNAELWHQHSRMQTQAARKNFKPSDLSTGLLLDALWLRLESGRLPLQGTAALCLAWLLTLCLFSGVVGVVLAGSWRGFCLQLGHPFGTFFIAVAAVALVSFGTMPTIRINRDPQDRGMGSLARQSFFAGKLALLMVFLFLSSEDVCQPLQAHFSAWADVLHIFLFVILALFGWRWGYQDQERRCSRCLRLLSSPARVGRPSHNLLEWNGTEMVCSHGHGLLNIPEMETSWCQFSKWVSQRPDYDRPAST